MTTYQCCGDERVNVFQACESYEEDSDSYTRPHVTSFRVRYPRQPCRECLARRRRTEEREALNRAQERGVHERRAKQLHAYFRGDERLPFTADDMAAHYLQKYQSSQRLHYFFPNDPRIAQRRTEIQSFISAETEDDQRREFLCTLPGRFEEMLRRQEELDRTGRPLTVDDLAFIARHVLNLTPVISPEDDLRRHHREAHAAGLRVDFYVPNESRVESDRDLLKRL